MRWILRPACQIYLRAVAVFQRLGSLSSALIGSEQAHASEKKVVLIQIKLSGSAFDASKETYDLYVLEDDVQAALGDSGQLDGHEIGQGYFAIHIYAANPDALITKLAPILSGNTIPTGSYLEVRDSIQGRTVNRIELPLTTR